MPEKIPNLQASPAFAALSVQTAAECLSMLAGVTGTHALLLDATDDSPPQIQGLGRWTVLRLSQGGHLQGPVHAQIDALPFSDDSFSLVLIRHLAGAGVPPEALVGEAVRVLASHGLLLTMEFHPCSLWRPWLAKRRRHGDTALREVAPSRWQIALGARGVTVRTQRRCGAPWPRAQGTRGLPRWVCELAGAVYLLKARKRDESGVVQRLQSKRTRAAREQVPWASGAQRTHG
ncbi:MAG TPA: methyltransferase domain-containing protein [Rhodanobacteraceae bacterium]|nr:methyltransferase domain-containing protein [Rhodanobacteraceae bacterium]